MSSSLPLFSLLFFFSFPSSSLVFFPSPKRFHNTIPRRRVETVFLKGTKTEQDNGQDEDNFHAFFLLLLLSSPGGFFIHDTLSQKENAKWRITVDTCLLKLLFGNPKTREENNHFQLSTHPPCIIILLPMYQRKNPIKFGKISLFEKFLCFIPPTIPPNLANRQGPPRKRGFFRT